jgi:hypothetical protein
MTLRQGGISDNNNILTIRNIGNKRFRFIIPYYLDSFKFSKSRKEKGKVVSEILQHIQMAGGRFLERDKCNPYCWLPVSTKLARMKVSHALRDKCTLDRPDEAHFVVKLRINDYSAIKKEMFLDELTCALLRLPLPIRDENHYVDSMLRNEVLNFLQKSAPVDDYKCIGLCKNIHCVFCITMSEKAVSESYLGIQGPDPEPEFISVAIARNSCSDAYSEDTSIENLENFKTFMSDDEDLSFICLSSLPLKNNQNFCDGNNLDLSLSIDKFTMDYSAISKMSEENSKIEYLPDDFTPEDFKSIGEI